MSTTEQKKKSSWKSWAIVVACLIVISVASTGIIKNESVNNALIESSASTMASSIIEERPQAGPVLRNVADALEAAVEARKSDPKELIAIVNSLVEGQGLRFDTSPIVNALIAQINEAHKTSTTEEIYHQKILSLVRGLRSGVWTEEDKEEDVDDADTILLDADEPCEA